MRPVAIRSLTRRWRGHPICMSAGRWQSWSWALRRPISAARGWQQSDCCVLLIARVRCLPLETDVINLARYRAQTCRARLFGYDVSMITKPFSHRINAITAKDPQVAAREVSQTRNQLWQLSGLGGPPRPLTPHCQEPKSHNRRGSWRRRPARLQRLRQPFCTLFDDTLSRVRPVTTEAK